MVTLHGGLARATVFYSLIMGLWALWRFMRREEASPTSEGMPMYSATTFVLDAARLVRV